MATSVPGPDTDYAAHAQTYRSFVHGVQLSVAATLLLLILLAVFLL
jgi:hypothetical protein